MTTTAVWVVACWWIHAKYARTAAPRGSSCVGVERCSIVVMAATREPARRHAPRPLGAKEPRMRLGGSRSHSATKWREQFAHRAADGAVEREKEIDSVATPLIR